MRQSKAEAAEPVDGKIILQYNSDLAWFRVLHLCMGRESEGSVLSMIATFL